MAFKNMAGHRIGHLTVVERLPNDSGGTAMWLCVCDCGAKRAIAGTALRAGRHKSCGCQSPRFTTEKVRKHGLSASRTYRIWHGMKQRCQGTGSTKTRRNYHDKGIRVIERWEKFENFLADMGEAPPGASLDRIDGSGNYEPTNCRWATAKEQANNTVTNRYIDFEGRRMTIAMWAAEIGITPNTLLYRLRRGMPVNRALQKTVGHAGTQRKEERRRACASCGSLFIPRATQIKQGAGLYCSRACIVKTPRPTIRKLLDGI